MALVAVRDGVAEGRRGVSDVERLGRSEDKGTGETKACADMVVGKGGSGWGEFVLDRVRVGLQG